MKTEGHKRGIEGGNWAREGVKIKDSQSFMYNKEKPLAKLLTVFLYYEAHSVSWYKRADSSSSHSREQRSSSSSSSASSSKGISLSEASRRLRASSLSISR